MIRAKRMTRAKGMTQTKRWQKQKDDIKMIKAKKE